MAALLYKDHLIVATCQYDRVKSVWRSIVDVSWGSGSDRGFHVITDLAKSFQTAEDAETFGVETGKTWVDERLKWT